MQRSIPMVEVFTILLNLVSACLTQKIERIIESTR